MPKTPTQKAANARYMKKTYEQLIVNVRNDAEINGAVIREHAARHNESVNGFLTRAVTEAIERDNATQI